MRVLIASGARFDPGPARGRVTPEIVGPRTAQDATLVLPGDRDWGVWVDTGDGPNLYFLASDFPIGATGRAPFTLIVDSHYGVGVDIPEEVHGWLGQ